MLQQNHYASTYFNPQYVQTLEQDWAGDYQELQELLSVQGSESFNTMFYPVPTVNIYGGLEDYFLSLIHI